MARGQEDEGSVVFRDFFTPFFAGRFVSEYFLVCRFRENTLVCQVPQNYFSLPLSRKCIRPIIAKFFVFFGNQNLCNDEYTVLTMSFFVHISRFLKQVILHLLKFSGQILYNVLFSYISPTHKNSKSNISVVNPFWTTKVIAII